MFDETPLVQKVLRRGASDATIPSTPTPVTPVKNLDLSDSFEGPESKENLLGLQEGKNVDFSRAALISKNK
jgi:hypothetical protein